MRRRDQPEPAETPPVDRAQVHALVAELHAATCRGESIHGTPPIYALNDLCGSCMAGYYVKAMLARPDGPEGVSAMVEHIMEIAARVSAGTGA